MQLRSLEARLAPAAFATLNLANDLGTFTSGTTIGRVGTIAHGADVCWYSFTLNSPERISLAATAGPHGKALPAVLSLYNSDPFDFGDSYDPLQYRLLDQASSTNGAARIDCPLAANKYYIAVSGAGNDYFHPFIADSGYPGATGNYTLTVKASDPGLPTGTGPVVLSTDPAAGAVLNRSPFVLRVDFSSTIDPSTVVLDQNVTLTYNPTGNFGNGQDVDVTPGSYNLSSTGNELQLFPNAPLAPGYYRLFLGGAANAIPLADPNGMPLAHDFVLNFRVAGIKGSAAGDETIATAHSLGDLTHAGRVQMAGAIGNDPTDNAYSMNDVDFYHFTIHGPGRFVFGSEVWAGRIGSPLDPAISLWQRDANGSLHFVASNLDTLNDTLTADGNNVPLFTDAALFQGLTAGDYYLAVSSGQNVPNPDGGVPVGSPSIFDPNVPDSGTLGNSTGDYVLNLLVQPDNTRPHVIAVTPGAGATLAGPPTELTVRFDKPVNLQELAYTAYQQTSQASLTPVYIQGAQGRYYPRLEGFNPATNVATFLMLDGLASGKYQLHLSGPLGLTDFAGNPLAGNSPSGDYIVSFTVANSQRGVNGNPLVWSDQEPNDTFNHPYVIGTLFPHELQSGVTITRNFANPSSAPLDTADYYEIRVLQNQHYIISLPSGKLPANAVVTLQDASGQMLSSAGLANGYQISTYLNPGVYVIGVGSWTPLQAAGVTYQLQINLDGVLENPPPLTLGPAPALSFRLVSEPAPAHASLPVTTIRPSPAPQPFEVPLAVVGTPPGVVSSFSTGPVGGVQTANLPVSASEHLYVGAEAQVLRDSLLQSLFAFRGLWPDGDDSLTEQVSQVDSGTPAVSVPPPAPVPSPAKTPDRQVDAMVEVNLLPPAPRPAAPTRPPVKSAPAVVRPPVTPVMVVPRQGEARTARPANPVRQWSWVLPLTVLAAMGGFTSWWHVRRRRVVVHPVRRSG